MAQDIITRLRIKEGQILRTIHAPKEFEEKLGELPRNVKISATTRNFHQVHWFVKNMTALKKDLKKVMGLISENKICWIYFPKRNSGIQTDLTRDTALSLLMKEDKQWVNLISFDSTWSAFGFRGKTEADHKKEKTIKVRPILDWVDPKTRTVRIPDDLQQAFSNHKKAESLFHSLAFTHKKEYVEWIITARKEETRIKRIRGTIEKLEEKSKVNK